MQVKIFRHPRTHSFDVELENLVNDWLKSQKGIELHNVVQNFAGDEIIVTLFYTLMEPKEYNAQEELSIE